MSASTATETRPTPSQNRKRGGNRGRGRGAHHRNESNPNKAARRSGDNKPTDDAAPPPTANEVTPTDTPSANSTDDAPVCWICAEPVKYYSLSACNHRTCHVCALRLRALYKKLECTFCKVGIRLSPRATW